MADRECSRRASASIPGPPSRPVPTTPVTATSPPLPPRHPFRSPLILRLNPNDLEALDLELRRPNIPNPFEILRDWANFELEHLEQDTAPLYSPSTVPDFESAGSQSPTDSPSSADSRPNSLLDWRLDPVSSDEESENSTSLDQHTAIVALRTQHGLLYLHPGASLLADEPDSEVTSSEEESSSGEETFDPNDLPDYYEPSENSEPRYSLGSAPQFSTLSHHRQRDHDSLFSESSSDTQLHTCISVRARFFSIARSVGPNAHAAAAGINVKRMLRASYVADSGK
ncbi:MAG: hypothetical protein M1825_003204 [Sarcosagium campestre]|nr:MAG: hypothetical protein M1825_003204 [Sarcosagium campestre]